MSAMVPVCRSISSNVALECSLWTCVTLLTSSLRPLVPGIHHQLTWYGARHSGLDHENNSTRLLLPVKYWALSERYKSCSDVYSKVITVSALPRL